MAPSLRPVPLGSSSSSPENTISPPNVYCSPRAAIEFQGRSAPFGAEKMLRPPCRIRRISRTTIAYLLFHEIQRPFQFQLQLRPFRQVQLAAAARLHEIRRERPHCSAFGCLFLVFVFDALHGADCCACRSRLRGILLRAASALYESLLPRTRFHAVVARHVHDFGHDWQIAEPGVDFVKRQPKFRTARHSCRLDMADVTANLRSGWQKDAARRFEWLQRLHLEPGVGLRTFSAQLFIQPHQKLGARGHCVGFNRQPVPLTVRLMTLLVWRWRCCFSRLFLTLLLLLRLAHDSQRKRHRENRQVAEYTPTFHAFHRSLPRNAGQEGNAHGEP